MNSKIELLWVFVTLSILALTFFLQILFSEWSLRTLEILLKISIPLAAYFFLKNIVQDINDPICLRIVMFNSLFLVGNIILAQMGVGYSNYTDGQDGSIGGTGYFYAGNEVSVALVFALLTLLLYRDKISELFISVLGVLSGLVILSKVAILSSLTLFAFTLYRKSKLLFLSGGLSISGLIVYYLNTIYFIFNSAINRWNYFIDLYGIEFFLLGGYKRVTHITEYIKSIIDEPLLLLIGFGWTGDIENNFFDLIQGYGFFVGGFIFIIWVVLLFPNFVNLTKYGKVVEFELIFCVSSMLIFVSLVLAGHVVQSNLIVPFSSVYFLYNAQKKIK